MALLKALASALGGFREISASDQIACDAGAMTVTPTGGTQQSVPAAIAARVLGDANGKVRPSKLEIGSVAANLCLGGDMEEVANGIPVGWGPLASNTSTGSTVTAYTGAAQSGTTALLLSKATNDTNSQVATISARMSIEALATYECLSYVTAVSATGTTVGFTVWAFFYDKTDTYLSTVALSSNGPVVNGGFSRRAYQVQAPAGASYARLAFLNGTASTAQYVVVDSVVFRRVGGATSIEDAAITPLKLYAPTRGQFFRALENSGAGRVATVTAAVPSDQGDATNIAFNHTTFVAQAGPLAQFVKTTLSLTDAQLASIITAARSVAE